LKNKRLAQPVKVRFEGDEISAKAAILALKQSGFNIQNLSKPYRNSDGNSVRYYLEIYPHS
jgi:hypothetical protein